MRLALAHAARAGFDPGAPAAPDPAPSAPTDLTDCLLVLAGVEPEATVEETGAERIQETAEDLRCDDALLVFCPALVAAAAERPRAERVLDALAGDLDVDTTVAPTDRHLALRVETKGHPSAVRTLEPGASRSATPGVDLAPLERAGLADATEAGLRWTPEGVVARRALVAGIAERFAAVGAEPVDPPLAPDREGATETVPDALRLSDPPVLLRPRATFGVTPERAVYAVGPAVEGGTGVHRPEALDPAPDIGAWLRLTDETLRALGFDPTVHVGDGDLADVTDDSFDVERTLDADRVEFRTGGPTGVVERTERGLRCAPVGSARRALAAVADDLPVALAPTQLRLVPIDSEDERCRALAGDLSVRTDVDDRDRPTGERLRDAEDVPFVAVVGPDDDALPVAGPDGRERRVDPEQVDALVREMSGGWPWPPARARRPVSLSARNASTTHRTASTRDASPVRD